jgi:hypothetical protein
MFSVVGITAAQITPKDLRRRKARVARRLLRKAEIVVELQEAHGYGGPPAVAQGADQGYIGAAADDGVLPELRLPIASRGTQLAPRQIPRRRVAKGYDRLRLETLYSSRFHL